MNAYELPYIQFYKLKGYMAALFVFCLVCFIALAFFAFDNMSKDGLLEGLLFGTMFSLLAVAISYTFIAGSLKKYFIELTPEKIRFQLPVKAAEIAWGEIYEVNLYSYNMNTFVSILLKRDLTKKYRRSIGGSFNSLLGLPAYSYQIPTRIFSGVDTERLVATIQEQIDKASNNENSAMASTPYLDEEANNNFVKAFTLTFLLTFICGIIYGFSIYKLETNYLVIPIFASLMLIAVFNKFYIEETFNLMVRIITGLLCFLQVPIAIITTIQLGTRLPITIQTISATTKAYFSYLFHNPTEHVVVIIIAVICFGYGAMRGRTYDKDK